MKRRNASVTGNLPHRGATLLCFPLCAIIGSLAAATMTTKKTKTYEEVRSGEPSIICLSLLTRCWSSGKPNTFHQVLRPSANSNSCIACLSSYLSRARAAMSHTNKFVWGCRREVARSLSRPQPTVGRGSTHHHPLSQKACVCVRMNSSPSSHAPCAKQNVVSVADAEEGSR